MKLHPQPPGAAADDPLRLDNQLCFALYAATHAMTKAYRPLVGRLGLTYPQYLVLLALWEIDNQTVSAIGARLRLDSGTLTPMLKRLEAMQLITRSRRREDEREVEIGLTEAGRTLQTAAYEVRAQIVCQLGMTEAEIRHLRADLMELVSMLDSDTSQEPASPKTPRKARKSA